MMENNNQKTISSSTNDDSLMEIIVKFLKDNGLEENKKEIYEKIRRGQHSWRTIVKHATLDLDNNKISEKELSSILEKELNISKDTVIKLAKNIKTDLLPLIKKFTATDNSIKSQQAPAPPKIKSPDMYEKKEPIKKIPKIVKTIEPSISIKKIDRPDNYREPIE